MDRRLVTLSANSGAGVEVIFHLREMVNIKRRDRDLTVNVQRMSCDFEFDGASGERVFRP